MLDTATLAAQVVDAPPKNGGPECTEPHSANVVEKWIGTDPEEETGELGNRIRRICQIITGVIFALLAILVGDFLLNIHKIRPHFQDDALGFLTTASIIRTITIVIIMGFLTSIDTWLKKIRLENFLAVNQAIRDYRRVDKDYQKLIAASAYEESELRNELAKKNDHLEDMKRFASVFPVTQKHIDDELRRRAQDMQAAFREQAEFYVQPSLELEPPLHSEDSEGKVEVTQKHFKKAEKHLQEKAYAMKTGFWWVWELAKKYGYQTRHSWKEYLSQKDQGSATTEIVE
jgi:hypothetical protein